MGPAVIVEKEEKMEWVAVF